MKIFFRDTVHTFVNDIVTGPTSALSHRCGYAVLQISGVAAVESAYTDSYYEESSESDTVFDDYGYRVRHQQW